MVYVIQKEKPKVEVEYIIFQTGGVKSLIGCLHWLASIEKDNKTKNGLEVTEQSDSAQGMKLHIHVPDGLPKSQEEVMEEEKSWMPDSAFTKLLRTKGTIPAWFSHALDHETDWKIPLTPYGTLESCFATQFYFYVYIAIRGFLILLRTYKSLWYLIVIPIKYCCHCVMFLNGR